MRAAAITLGVALTLVAPAGAAAEGKPPSLLDPVDDLVTTTTATVREVGDAAGRVLAPAPTVPAPLPVEAAPAPPAATPTATAPEAAAPRPRDPVRPQPTPRPAAATATPAASQAPRAVARRNSRAASTTAPLRTASVDASERPPRAAKPEPEPAARKSQARPGTVTRFIALIPGWVKLVLGAGALALAFAVAALARSRRRLAAALRLAHFDALTGLPNRAAADEALRHLVALCARRQAPLAVVMLDVDHFKSINDDFGHQAGDAVLADLGPLVRSSVRGGDFVGRYGGEELMLLLPDTDLPGAVHVAEGLRERIAEARFGTLPRNVTASMGVAAGVGDDEALTALVGAADAALYQAKADGRDRVAVADASVVRVPAMA